MPFNLAFYAKYSESLNHANSPCVSQVQAIGMYGAAQPDFFKSETT